MTLWNRRRARPRSAGSAVGDHHRTQLEARRRGAAGLVDAKGSVAERIASAPAAYLLVHGSSDIARHAELLTPLPAAREVRVAATPGRLAGEWRLDIASRDRPGLLAAFSGELATAGLDVAQAVIATWDDGAALQAFVIHSPHAPDPSSLETALAASLDRPMTSEPVPDATVVFDDDASEVATGCDLRAADRSGLLHAMAVAIAAAGADVHAARVTTTAGFAHDRFDLTDRAGRKLDRATKDAIGSAIRRGVSL